MTVVPVVRSPRSWISLLAVLLLLHSHNPIQAQPAAKTLRWGGDAAGGAPFIYGPETERVGFEVELAAYLGKQLGRQPAFVQAQWDTLPDLVQNRKIDIALNGLEYLPDREKDFATTVPYFIYTLRLIVPREGSPIRGWDDLEQAGKMKWRIGVLRGSVAEKYVRQHFGDDAVAPANEVDETFQLVEGGRLAATVQDSPAAVYYIESGKLPKLKVVGEPVSPGYYIILANKDDDDLRNQLNAALREGLRNGQLKRIYSKYNLWTPEQEKLLPLAEGTWPPAAEETPEQPFAKVTMTKLAPLIARAAWMTIKLACCSMPLAILFGIAIAVGRLYGPWLVRAPLALHVEVFRGTPLLLQMYVLYFLLPRVAEWVGFPPLIRLFSVNEFYFGVAGLVLNYAAYESEIYRAGLLAIPRGQMEAALSLGMSRATAIRRILLPQAMRLVVPPVTNDFIALFKDTSICSAILITDLTGLYFQYKNDRGIVLQLALVVALLYFAMSYPLSLLARRLESRQQAVHG